MRGGGADRAGIRSALRSALTVDNSALVEALRDAHPAGETHDHLLEDGSDWGVSPVYIRVEDRDGELWVSEVQKAPHEERITHEPVSEKTKAFSEIVEGWLLSRNADYPYAIGI